MPDLHCVTSPPRWVSYVFPVSLPVSLPRSSTSCPSVPTRSCPSGFSCFCPPPFPAPQRSPTPVLLAFHPMCVCIHTPTVCQSNFTPHGKWCSVLLCFNSPPCLLSLHYFFSQPDINLTPRWKKQPFVCPTLSCRQHLISRTDSILICPELLLLILRPKLDASREKRTLIIYQSFIPVMSWKLTVKHRIRRICTDHRKREKWSGASTKF